MLSVHYTSVGPKYCIGSWEAGQEYLGSHRNTWAALGISADLDADQAYLGSQRKTKHASQRKTKRASHSFIRYSEKQSKLIFLLLGFGLRTAYFFENKWDMG